MILQTSITDEEELFLLSEESTNFEIYCERKLSNYEEIVGDKSKHDISITSSVSEHEGGRVVKLPKLIIEKFDGDFKKWQSFSDSFSAAVHSKPISNVEKFNYLKSYLIDEALRVIDGLSLTNENYDKAMGLLKERFGNKQSIINAHMKKLLEIEKIEQENTEKLRRMYDEITTHVRSLQSLGIEGENFGAILIPVILERLPGDFKRHLNRANENGGMLRMLGCYETT